MRAEKAEKYTELKSKRNDPEYEEWFLRYRPLDTKKEKEEDQEKSSKKTNKTKTNRKKKRKTRKRRGLFF
jgi:hypothetical protein